MCMRMRMPCVRRFVMSHYVVLSPVARLTSGGPTYLRGVMLVVRLWPEGAALGGVLVHVERDRERRCRKVQLAAAL